MSTAGSPRTVTEGRDLAEQRVTPLELFFDLVFVFALTQVTGFLTDHLTWTGMLQGTALLAVLWWAWVGYSWLTNAVPAEEAIPARLVILTAVSVPSLITLAILVVLLCALAVFKTTYSREFRRELRTR